jgi:transcriptional regulator
MYVPSSFIIREARPLIDFMRAHSFAALVSSSPAAPVASHLPLLVDEQDGQVVLRGHVARANSQWQAHPMRVLAIFSGPHAYISPTWYQADDVVPTWNYQAVHAVGTLQLCEAEEDVRRFFADLATTYEGEQARLWQERLSADTFTSFCQQIVCFRIQVESLQGAWKLSQNHPLERRRQVIVQLRRQGGENEQAIAAAMEATLGTNQAGRVPG